MAKQRVGTDDNHHSRTINERVKKSNQVQSVQILPAFVHNIDQLFTNENKSFNTLWRWSFQDNGDCESHAIKDVPWAKDLYNAFKDKHMHLSIRPIAPHQRVVEFENVHTAGGSYWLANVITFTDRRSQPFSFVTLPERRSMAFAIQMIWREEQQETDSALL
ncbi:hypothetical protein GHT06_015999 [Daphnia sinensis]|uniref:Uncharacterized protein n=1 Tax=Daphnia sinensis TaxID=1820382 RepID=A0AAD5LAS2_9CRUS|nr:hypothetical protein GHT06_015999 [Daphnia sinensis]